MKKALVLYGTKHGTTKQYADWIAGELGADEKNVKNITPAQAAGYDIIVLGGALYASNVLGISFFIKNFDKLKNKKLVLFTCGLADPKVEENQKYIKENIYKKFTPEMREHIMLFHLRGGIDYTSLSLMHKLMMSALKKMTEKKSPEELTSENREFLDTYGKKIDFTSRDFIFPIIEYIKKEV